ncbi:MAG: pantoate--beta-alanine ligase [Bacteroidales bacterium]|nr:pantoate--beta-alanine ligase [Bacteroidales bacterium]HOY38891.1 pantoate--beta-alanine ligase [Bacteroidales bacterium]HQP04272.1 pantoate--beta-alanine ligase [Bacteroidales bacterium]
MKVFTSHEDLNYCLSEYRSGGLTIGFVPTMGALHAGHISLIKKSTGQNKVSVVSVFVNPRQFNDSNDFTNYPRNISADIKLIEAAGCEFVYTPDYQDLFPTEDSLEFDFNGLDKVLEGAYRPGHFQGVVDVVHALFKAVRPNNAYFGLKDYQQLKIIQLLASQFHPKTNIIPCPIIREPDGLAMSSRNQRLQPDERKAAAMIPKILMESAAFTGNHSVAELKANIVSRFNKAEGLKLEYAEICNSDNLEAIDSGNPAKGNLLLVAVWCNKIRLIDNIYLNS